MTKEEARKLMVTELSGACFEYWIADYMKNEEGKIKSKGKVEGIALVAQKLELVSKEEIQMMFQEAKTQLPEQK